MNRIVPPDAANAITDQQSAPGEFVRGAPGRQPRRVLLLSPLLLLSGLGLSRFMPGALARTPQRSQQGRTIHDSAAALSFDLPAAWPRSRKDGELSTFRLDAPTAPPGAEMRAAAALDHNPFPESTFTSAFFYLSVSTHTSGSECAAEARQPGGPPTDIATFAGQTFTHGQGEHGTICPDTHTEVYTLARANGCVRFDLVRYNFCGGSVSGVRDMTPREVQAIDDQLKGILATVRFDSR